MKSSEIKTFKGIIAKELKSTPKVMYSALKIAENKPMQLVLYINHRPPILKDVLTNANVGDEVTVVGKLETNPRNNETQIVIDEIYSGNYQKQEEVHYYFNKDSQCYELTNDPNLTLELEDLMAMPDRPKPPQEQSFKTKDGQSFKTDGIHIITKGTKVRLTEDFVEKWNHTHTMEDWIHFYSDDVIARWEEIEAFYKAKDEGDFSVKLRRK